jgi:DNA-binding beta-propeller fold protein YncE
MVATQRDGRRAWTANMQDGTVTEYDVDTRTTKRTYPVAADDEAIAASPGGVEIWVGSNTAKTVTVIDGPKATPITTLTGFSMPYRVAISRSGRTAVVSDPVANQLRLFDLATKKELAVIDLATAPGVGKPAIGTSSGPEGIAFDPISDVAYITLHGTNQVAALDVRQKKIVGVGSVGAGPDGIAFSPLERQ